MLAALVLCRDLGRLPIEIWDESRLAHNALEMSRGGDWAVPRFGDAPDRWNTKPPLAIWLMAASVSAFGVQQWALRLTSALSGLATAMLLFGWCALRLRRRLRLRLRLRQPATGFVAVAVLLAGSGFVHVHAARSADHDALLALCTTALLLAAYAWLVADTPRARARWLAATAVAGVLAFLAKAMQGWMFLPGIALWAAASGRLVPRLRTRALGIAVLAAAACVLGD